MCVAYVCVWGALYVDAPWEHTVCLLYKKIEVNKNVSNLSINSKLF